jgi:hypothetical protein
MFGLFQILFSVFAVGALSATVLQYKQRGLSGRATWFWILVWLGAWAVVVWPTSTQRLASALGIGRGTDVVVYAAIAVIFFLLFRLHVKMEMVSRQITRVVRDEAIKSN